MEPEIKHTIFSCTDFTIYFERVKNGPLLLHVDFSGKWSKASKRIFQGVLDDICSGLKENLFAIPYITDKKMEKFTKICRLKKFTDLKCPDGITRPLYIRSN